MITAEVPTVTTTVNFNSPADLEALIRFLEQLEPDTSTTALEYSPVTVSVIHPP